MAFVLIASCNVRDAKAQNATPAHGFDMLPPNPTARVKEPEPLAAAPALPPDAPRVTPRRWYGNQTLVLDGVALGFFAGALATSGDRDAIAPLFGLSAGVYFLGAPIVHAAHSNWTSLGLSSATRVLLPLLGGVIGSGLDDCNTRSSDLCGIEGTALGVLFGASVAITLDAAVFAREPRAESARASLIPPLHVAVAPFARADKNRGLLGLAGTF